MPLSEQEQRVLDAMERSLYETESGAPVVSRDSGKASKLAEHKIESGIVFFREEHLPQRYVVATIDW